MKWNSSFSWFMCLWVNNCLLTCCFVQSRGNLSDTTTPLPWEQRVRGSSYVIWVWIILRLGEFSNLNRLSFQSYNENEFCFGQLRSKLLDDFRSQYIIIRTHALFADEHKELITPRNCWDHATFRAEVRKPLMSSRFLGRNHKSSIF